MSGRGVAPKRIQRKRTKGWRMPENAVYVGRPSKWGNPFRIGGRDHDNDVIEDAADAKRAFSVFWGDLLDPYSPVRLEREALLRDLQGRDLACWCPLDAPCHADVLLDLANPGRRASREGDGS